MEGDDGLMSKHRRRKFLIALTTAGVSCLLVAVIFSSTISEHSETVLSEQSSTASAATTVSTDDTALPVASRGSRRSKQTVKVEEKLAADRLKEMLRMRPTVEKTEDTYLAARAREASVRASASDVASEQRHLDAQVASDKQQVSKAEAARKQMTIAVAAAQSTLNEARKLAAKGQQLEDYSKESRSASELDEAEGVAIQQPAEELLKDSKKLNDQSNLVLDQSHSPQAKALAALDLKMAQSLAQRAGKGMSSAKAYFARAIAARKRAVEEDVQASSAIRKAAKASLAEQPGVPSLLHVVHGEVRGPQALSDIVTADVQDVDRKEEALGQAEGVLQGDKLSLAWASEQLEQLATRSAALKQELAGAQKAVQQAQAAHDAAERELQAATSQGLTAQAAVDSLRSSEVQGVRARLAAVVSKKRLAERKYRAAVKKVADLNGHQTLLQVEVARLTLELKEAQMQRDDADAKQAAAQQTINSLQVQLDKENEDLSQARLRLADERLGMEPAAGGSAAAAEGDEAASAARSEGGSAVDSGSLSEGLDEERHREELLRRQQQAAERAAHDEELKLRRAQAAVAAQMAKVASLEQNIR